MVYYYYRQYTPVYVKWQDLWKKVAQVIFKGHREYSLGSKYVALVYLHVIRLSDECCLHMW